MLDICVEFHVIYVCNSKHILCDIVCLIFHGKLDTAFFKKEQFNNMRKQL